MTFKNLKTAATLLGLSFVLINCTHTANLRGFPSGSGALGSVKDRKVAVVVLPGKIQDNHSTKTDVYTYAFSGVTDGVTDALKARIAMTAKQVDVVNNGTAKPAGYDLYVYPEVAIRSVHDFWTMGCLVKFHLEIQGKDGRVVSNQSGEGKRNFLSANQADDKCKEAMSDVFVRVTNAAFSAPM